MIGHRIQGSAVLQAADARFQPLWPTLAATSRRPVLLGTLVDAERVAVGKFKHLCSVLGETPLARACVLPVPAAQERKSLPKPSASTGDAAGCVSHVAVCIENIEFATVPAARAANTPEQVARPTGACASCSAWLHHAQLPAMVLLWMFPLAIGRGNASSCRPASAHPRFSLLLSNGCKTLARSVLRSRRADSELVDATGHPGIAAVRPAGLTPVAEHITGGTAHGSASRMAGPRTI